MLSSIAVVGGGALIGKGIHNKIKSNNHAERLGRNWSDNIRRDDSKYILRYNVPKGGVKYVTVHQDVQKYDPPVYINTGGKHGGGIGIPIGGNTYIESEKVLEFTASNISELVPAHRVNTYIHNIYNIVPFKQQLSLSKVKKLMEQKYRFNFNQPVKNNLLTVTEYEFENDTYFYGNGMENNEDKFEFTDVSDNASKLAEKVTHITYLPQIVIGAMIVVIGLMTLN